MPLNSPSSIDRLNMSDSTLHDFVLHQSGAHVKDSKTGIYTLANQDILELFGREKTDDLGTFSIYELAKFMQPCRVNKYADEISGMDQMVAATGTTTTKNKDIVLNASGVVYVQDLLKLPLTNRNNKVVAILTISTDLTQKTNLFRLLELHINTHLNLSTGLVNFVKYLGIDGFFCEDLTYKEIICLLQMRITPAYKSIAKNLNIGARTVETHISHIIDKLNGSHQLSDVLIHLRSRQNP